MLSRKQNQKEKEAISSTRYPKEWWKPYRAFHMKRDEGTTKGDHIKIKNKNYNLQEADPRTSVIKGG